MRVMKSMLPRQPQWWEWKIHQYKGDQLKLTMRHMIIAKWDFHTYVELTEYQQRVGTVPRSPTAIAEQLTREGERLIKQHEEKYKKKEQVKRLRKLARKFTGVY